MSDDPWLRLAQFVAIICWLLREIILGNLNELLYLFKEIIDPTAGVIISVLVFFIGRLLLVYRLFWLIYLKFLRPFFWIMLRMNLALLGDVFLNNLVLIQRFIILDYLFSGWWLFIDPRSFEGLFALLNIFVLATNGHFLNYLFTNLSYVILAFTVFGNNIPVIGHLFLLKIRFRTFLNTVFVQLGRCSPSFGRSR